MRIFSHLLQFLAAVLRCAVHCLMVLLHCGKRKVVPAIKDPLLLKSATLLAKEIREGKLKSVEVVYAYIERIRDVDPCINATVDRRFQEAIKEASEADLLIASGKYTAEQLRDEKPLLGVPFTVKILLLVKDLRCTAGSKLFEDLVSTEDAPSVALMKEAGAIAMATTNAPEFAMNIETVNKVHGRSRNPYDTNRTPGGSSGGESALIASGGSVLGLGNDILGSLRIPAHFSGIFSHKPTQGLVPSEGSFPPERLFGERHPKPDIYNYTCTGPMCRYAEDLVTSMKVLSTGNETKLKLGKEINFGKLKICCLKEIESYFVAPVDPEISRALRETVSYFEHQYGIKVKEVKMPFLMDAIRCILNTFHNSVQDITDVFTGGKGVDLNLKIDFIKSLFGKSTLTFSSLVAFNFARLPLIYRKSRSSHYEKELQNWMNEFSCLLDEDTVLLMPTMPFTAPYHHEGALLAINFCYTGICNLLGLPSTSCPIGFNKHGLPIGIQIVGCKNNDHLTIACAVELEKAFGGWRVPAER